MATPDGDSISLSGDPRINGLLQGGSWDFGGGGATLTWSVHAFSAEEITPGWINALTQTFAAWTAVANIGFTRVAAPVQEYAHPSAGDIAITLLGVTGSAYAAAVFPDADVGNLYLEGWSNRTAYPRPEGDIDVYSGDFIFSPYGLRPGSLGFSTLLHEIGHALGLKHPHDDGLNGRPLLTGTGPNGIPYDDGFWTVMSYNDPYIDADMHGKQITPMPLDILAIQYIYGANMNYRTGNDTYLLQDDHTIRTIWDAGGIDTFSVSTATSGVVMSLNAGSFTQVGTIDYLNDDPGWPDPDDSGSHTAIAYNVTIENAIGSAYNDTILGNAVNNTLRGNAGNDVLNGGAGVDVLIGGMGNDTYHVDRAGDAVTESAGQGTDTINASASYSIAALVAIENLTLTGAGNINATGNTLANTLRGNNGANTLTGGTGNDTYYVGSNDRVIENVGEGTDTVIGTASYSFTALGITNVEFLLLSGSTDINATGNGVNNTLRGNFGDNVLDGRAGADVMIGGYGDDTYYVDNAGDTITELIYQGLDRVYSSVSIAALADHVEQLTLTGAAANAVGNDFSNTLDGNDLANILEGRDGVDRLSGYGGNDTLIGGLGDDRYIVDAADTVIEGVGEGNDTIEISGNYSIAALANIENIWFVGTGNYSAIGNLGDNALTGNYGNNTLNGGGGNDDLNGGGGNDTMIGGLGDDTYQINETGDAVVEASGEGIDHVYSSISFGLASTPHIENLTLWPYVVNINGSGNALDNEIWGNDGNNTLNGGLGNDVIHPGYGADRIVFSSALNAATNVDTIDGMVDQFLLDNDVFTSLSVGALGAAQFRIGAAATTAAHRIIYDISTGDLFYDADGSGAGAQILFADVGAMIGYYYSDFSVVD